MRFASFFAVALLACTSVVSADTNVYARRVNITSAQTDAEQMARTGVLRHCGRNGMFREGIGFSTSGPDAAIRSCCYYGRYRIVEKAVVWSPVRRGWFAVIRYE
jgi:DNA-directed RNA polymerase subunit N (RpoN/RPB10)